MKIKIITPFYYLIKLSIIQVVATLFPEITRMEVASIFITLFNIKGLKIICYSIYNTKI